MLNTFFPIGFYIFEVSRDTLYFQGPGLDHPPGHVEEDEAVHLHLLLESVARLQKVPANKDDVFYLYITHSALQIINS